MLILTDRLTTPALDWCVAKALGIESKMDYQPLGFSNVFFYSETEGVCLDYTPSKTYTVGGGIKGAGEIMDENIISTDAIFQDGSLSGWIAYTHDLQYDENGEFIEGSDNRSYGKTRLEAAMRCFVLSKLGTSVEVPDDFYT